MGFLQKLTRKKYIDFSHITDTNLARCLTAVDLTALGIGSTLGAGIYVVAGTVANDIAGPAVTLSFLIAGLASLLAGIGCTLGAGIYVVAGQVARQVTGPSVILSFFVAAFASMLAGLCYAEFGARVPKAGSAYVYSYVTLGELWAFVIGWNLILEYVIGTASVARAWSSYFDSLIDGAISKFFLQNMPMNIPSLSPYPDFFAFGTTILLCGILTFGVKESSMLNNVFTVINLLVVSFVFICGLFKVDIDNWQIPASQVPNATADGTGGFFPFGVGGMFSGAATCFYAFVGFDVIATTGEEVKNPQKSIPLGIIFSLLACFVAYCGVSAVITLMVPYYSISIDAPLPAAFEAVGWGVARYIIAVGAICGLSASLLGGMFPMPRIVYAMASDGLLFKFLANVNKRFKTPVYATLLTGLIAGLMAMLFDLKELVDMMSIGTLLAYTLVAMCVLILRFEVPREENGSTNAVIMELPANKADILLMLFKPRAISPDYHSMMIVKTTVFSQVVFIICFGGVALLLTDEILRGVWWAIFLLTITVVGFITTLIIIGRQPQSHAPLAFKVPWVPVLPAISMLINIYLMMQLPSVTWLRFAVWMALGFLIYFGYSVWHSVEGDQQREYERLEGDIYATASPVLTTANKEPKVYGTNEEASREPYTCE